MTRPLPDQSLGPEWTILELLARDVQTGAEQHLLRELLLAESLDWGELLEQALRHQMLALLAHQVVAADVRFEVPQSLYQHLETALALNRWQIELLRREAVAVTRALAERGIRVVATKGITFESTIYGGLGTRGMKDIDFMIAPGDRDAALAALQGLGYEPYFGWAKDRRREEIANRLHPDHLPKLARPSGRPVLPLLHVDIANSLTWTKSPFDVPVEEALADITDQPVPGSDARLPCFRPPYQLLFTVLHLLREAWLQRFADFGLDVTLHKFGDVLRLVERDRATLAGDELRRILAAHHLTAPFAWVLQQLDQTFHTGTAAALGLAGRGDDAFLAAAANARGYVRWPGSMRERLHSKTRRRSLQEIPRPAGS